MKHFGFPPGPRKSDTQQRNLVVGRVLAPASSFVLLGPDIDLSSRWLWVSQSAPYASSASVVCSCVGAQLTISLRELLEIRRNRTATSELHLERPLIRRVSGGVQNSLLLGLADVGLGVCGRIKLEVLVPFCLQLLASVSLVGRAFRLVDILADAECRMLS